jgi:hypothetical protein
MDKFQCGDKLFVVMGEVDKSEPEIGGTTQIIGVFTSIKVANPVVEKFKAMTAANGEPLYLFVRVYERRLDYSYTV